MDQGEVGREWIERVDGTHEEHAGNDQNEVYPGDVFVMQTPSGGGMGRFHHKILVLTLFLQ